MATNSVAPVAYVDVDVHQGDGANDRFAADPRVVFADIQQDGRTLFRRGPGAPRPSPGMGVALGG